MVGGSDGGQVVPPHVSVRARAEIPGALRTLGIGVGRPVVISVGGAGGMAARDLDALATAFERLVPVLDRWGAAVVDGGTDSGVMHAMGQAREAAGALFPLVGVAAEGTVVLPGRVPAPHAARLESRHSQVVLVPGDAWGDESPWIFCVASAIACGRPSLTLVSNGGEVTYDDIEHSLEVGWPVIVLAGTGRAADAVAAAAGQGYSGDRRAARIARSADTRIVPVGDTRSLMSAIESVLGSGG